MKKKLLGTQADRFIINLNDSKVSINDLKKQFQNFPIEGIKEIIVVKNGKVLDFYPFK